MEALKEIEAGNLENCFMELNACEGSCINGPGIRHHHSSSTLLSETKVDTFAGPADFQTPRSLRPGQAHALCRRT